MSTFVFPIERGHIMMFARSIGESRGSSYRHDGESDALVAPPTYAQVLAHYDEHYPHRPIAGQPWKGSGREATGTPGEDHSRGLHAEQHFEYGVPLRPGDTVSVTVTPGRRWEKEGRSGRLTFTELITDLHNQDGQLAVRIRRVGVVTGEPKSGEDT